MIKRLACAAALVLTALPAAADQCAWNSKAVSDAAAKMIAAGDTIQEFCKSCRDTKAKKIAVSSVMSRQVPGQASYYQVVVNGSRDLDIAYIYIRSRANRSQWTNLGLAASCDATEQDVPRLLRPEEVDS